MGNTNAGKSSLVNTFVRFMDNPSERPVSVLTQDHLDLKETEVTEIYDTAQLPGAQKLDVTLKTIDEESKVQLVSFSDPNKCQ